MNIWTIKTNRLKNILKGGLALAVLGAVTFLVPTPSAALDLMHNSKDTASTKWNSKWGVPGGRYGEFTCATCHEPNAKPNIKNVRATISVMNPTSTHLLPNGLKSIDVSYKNLTSQGNDRNNHATSNRICEVCHSQTLYHRYDSRPVVDKNHPAPKAGGTVCTSCHKHNTGFKGACGGCHGNPPRYATFGNDSGLVGKPRISNTLTPGQAGHHVTHTETRNMVCDTCHYISTTTAKMPNLSNTIDIGFFGFGGKVTSGTYIPYSAANRGYRVASGTPNTTIASISTDYSTANICANVYCHGGGLIVGGTVQRPPLTGGTNLVTPPRWDAPAQNQCGSCHGATASAPPTTAGHLKHASSATGYSFSCDLCHPAIDMGHVQGVVRWNFSQVDARTRGAKYQGFSSGNTGQLAPSTTFGDCSDVRCHGDGRGGPGYVATPTWGGSLPGNCIGCHGNTATTANPITSKGHKAHIYNTSARFNNFDFKCNECHVGTVDATDQALVSRTPHVNGTNNVSWGTTAAYVPSGGSAALPYNENQTCAVYCHSNGQGTFKAPPTAWKDIAEGAQGTIKCDYCHGGLASDGTAAVSSMRHTNHIKAGPLAHKPINCNWCHSNTVAPDGQSVYNGTNVKHINRAIDVSFFKMANFSGTYDRANKRCANTYCHTTGTVQTRDWDSTTINSCGNCHEANNSSTATTKLSDAHRKHYNTITRPGNTRLEGWSSSNRSVNTNVFMCGVCHWNAGGPTISHINGPPAGVTNGSVAEVAIKLPFTPPAGATRAETITRGTGVAYDGRQYGYSLGTSCDTYCHTDGRGGDPKIAGGKFVWTTTLASCGNCHNKYGDTGSSVTWSGNHSKHLAGSRSVNVSCNACHSGTAADNTSLLANSRAMHPNGFRNVTGNSTVTKGLRWNSSTQQCSNAYCHFNNTVTWGGQLPANCTGCHGGLAGSPNPIVTNGHKAHVDNDSARFGGFFFTCADCHANTTSTNDAISNPVFHANGSKDVVWGTRAGGTGTVAYAAGSSCTVYCHSNGKGVFRGQPKLWTQMTAADEGLINCDYCHNGLATDGTAISSARHTNHIGSGPLKHKPIQCNWCHSTTVGTNGVSVFNGTGVKHINRAVDVTFIKMANFSGSYDQAGTRVCTNTYCHGNNATTSVRDWDTTTINTCGNCHEANNSSTATTKLSDAHRKHYNTTVRPNSTSTAGWDNTNLSVNTNVFNCGVCHPADPTATHLNGPPATVTNGSVAEVALRLPLSFTSNRPESVTRGTGVNYDGRGYGYSTGTTCDTYCHSDGNGNPGKRNASSPTPLQWTTGTAIACGDCHNKASDSPTSTTWTKPHNKHANTYGNGGTVGSYNTTSNNTMVTCAACHASTAASNTSLVANSRAKHPNGFRNISASSTVGSAAFDWDKGNNQCKNGYCHSRAYSFTDYSTPWIKWSEAQVVNCGSCHTAYPTGPDYANGYKGKANSHPKHAVFWGFTCDWCHSQTVNSTGNVIANVRNHVNKNYNVAANSTKSFIGRTNTFTPAASTNPPVTRTTCSAVNCHGGNATQVFTWGGTNRCGDCHLGTADTVNYAFKDNAMAAINRTEWSYSGHGREGSNYTVTGNAFAGFSSAARTAGTSGDPCLYCHEYDAIPHGSATNPMRLRNFTHPTFGKNGVCLACHATVGATGVTPGVGYTSKTATKKVDKYHYGNKHGDGLNGGRFCWDCHDGHGDKTSSNNGPIAMVQLKPAMQVYTGTGVPQTLTTNSVAFTAKSTGSDFVSASFTGICNVCHTYKATEPNKMVHYTATSSDGHESGNLCTSCHTHSSNATYDGRAYEPSTNCNSCHDYDTVGATYGAGVWSGGYWGKNARDGLTPNEGWGAHAKHINYIKTRLGYSVVLNAVSQTYGANGSDSAKVCGTCHTNNLVDHTTDNSSQRRITFGDPTASFMMGGSGGTSLLFGTTFPAQNPLYNGVSGTSRATAPKTCSNISCHYFTTPSW